MCPNCNKAPLEHDNHKCPYRFAPAIMEWVELPEELAKLSTKGYIEVEP